MAFVLKAGPTPLAYGRPSAHSGRPRILMVTRADANDRRSRKGKDFEKNRRRRGRPAWMRSPYDTPLRDGNRDRLIGLLTERAAKTLMVYLMETNANVYAWLVSFYKANGIPKSGSWDEVSGDAFLRKLLSMPIEEAKFTNGRDPMYDCVAPCGVDPRSIAQRIMDIRSQLAAEFIQDLRSVSEENSLLLRETLQTSLANTFAAVVDTNSATATTPSSSDGPPQQSSPSTSKDAPPKASGSATSSPSASKEAASQSQPQQQQQPPPPKQPPSKEQGSTGSSADVVRSLNQQFRAPSPEKASGAGVSPEVLAQLQRALDKSDSASLERTGDAHPELLDTQQQQQQQQEGQGSREGTDKDEE